MRLASLAVTALLAAAAVASPAPAPQRRSTDLLKTLAGLLDNPTFSLLTGDAKDLLDLAKTIAANGTTGTPAAAVDVFGTPVYNSVSISNLPSSFALRQLARIDVTNEVNKFLYEELLSLACPALLGAVCSALADLAANNLNMMPSLNIIDSVSVSAPTIATSLDTTSLAKGAPALNVNGAADALVNFVIFPSPFQPMNRLFDLLKVRLMPISSVTYLGATGSAFSSVQSLLDLKVSGEAITVTQAFESIIEYKDSNLNGRYDVEETILQTYTLYDNPFKTAIFNPRSAASGASIYSITSTTLDNVVTFSCDVSSSAVAAGNDQADIISPAASGCKIQINNFPFKSSTSGLALTGYVASAVAVGSAHASAAANVTLSGINANSISIANLQPLLANATAPLTAYAAWNGHASAVAAGSSSSKGSASGSASAVAVGAAAADVIDGSNPIGIAAKFIAGADANGHASASAKRFIYSLTSSPTSSVTWSTSVGVGSTKAVTSSAGSAAAANAAPVAAAIAAAAAATGAMMF